MGHHIAFESHPLVRTEETRYYPMPIRVKGNKHHSTITRITRAGYGPKKLAVLPEKGGVHTGQSPPEEDQSFHSVRVPTTCGGTKTTHPPRGRLVDKHVEKTRPATNQRHKAQNLWRA